MKTIRQACIPRATTFDPARRDTVLDFSDLIGDRIDPAAFFAENHLTEGMARRTKPGRRPPRSSETGNWGIPPSAGAWFGTPSTLSGARRRAAVTRRTASRGCGPSCPATTGRGAKAWRQFFDTSPRSGSPTGAPTQTPPAS